MTDFNITIESATAFILGASLRTTFVLLVTILLGWSLRSASASSRRLVWIGGLTASLMVPLMMTFGPSVPIVVFSETTSQQDATPIDQVLPANLPAALSRQTDVAMTEAATLPDIDSGQTLQKSAGNEISQPIPTGSSDLTLAARQRRTQESVSPRSWALGWQSMMVVALLLGIVTQVDQRFLRQYKNPGSNTFPAG